MSQTQVHQSDRLFDMDNAVEEISREQIQSQTDLILESKHFRQARSLDKFLRYVVAKSLAGEEGDLKEYTIGVDVFQRGADFDPRKDAVVRVQANVLRKRLANYYEEEGLLDELVLEMPKGHYVPQFQRRSLKTDLASIEIQSAEAAEKSLVVLPSPVRSLRFRWKMFGLVAATFVLGLATAWLWQKPRGKEFSGVQVENTATDNGTVDSAFLPLWDKFLEPGVENVMAYGTPQFFVASGLYLRDVEVNSPEESTAAARLKLVQQTIHAPFTPAEIYTGVGETHGVYLLTKFFTRLKHELRVTRSRMVGWNEVKNSNIIFLSSMRFHTLAKELPFPSDFVIGSGVASKLINLHPQNGEPETYGGEGNGDYAVLTMWPGKLHQRRIMVLSGSTTWATLALAEYVTDVEYLRQLNHQLEQCRIKSGLEKHPPYFQVLVRTEVKDNQPVNLSYVTHHDLEIDKTNKPSPNPASVAKAANIARLTPPQR